MNPKKIIILFLFLLILPKISWGQTSIDPNFNPNRILEDAELLDTSSMTLSDIQAFLVNKNSYLANHRTENAYGTIKTAAEIIYDAAVNNYDIYYDSKSGQYKCDNETIIGEKLNEDEIKLNCRKISTVSPKFLLLLLQKETSLIENTNPSQNHLDWATGYMIFDGMLTCNPYEKCWRYKGFGKQVNSAALQFMYYLREPRKYAYQAGQTYTFANNYGTISKESVVVTPENKATAALYNYTPHVFNGNYNVFRLWQRYFGPSVIEPVKKIVKNYPDGSLLKIDGEPGIWLIEGGRKRPFLNYSAFISRFKPEQVVSAKAEELAKYEDGSPLKFANYSIVQTPDKQIYLLVDKEKRPFASTDVFKKIGFNQAELEAASNEDLAMYTTGRIITATSTNLTGVLMQDTKTGGVYYVVDGTKAPLTDKVLLETKFKGKKITKTNTANLDKYTTVEPVLLADGTLIKTDSFPTVYLISNGLKRPFADESTFLKLGYSMKNVVTASSKFLYNYSMGEIIKEEL